MIFLYLLITLLLLDIMVIFHEGGHYLTARACGIQVVEYSIGMGPKLISKVSKKSGIRYSLRALPFGGFVSMAGENGMSDAPNAFCNVRRWKRLLTLLAGPFVNILLGFIAMTVLVAITVPASNIVADFQEDAISCNQGLCAEDEIIKVNSVSVHTGSELVYEIFNQGAEPVDLTVVRNGETLILENVSFPTYVSDGITFGDYDFVLYAQRMTFGTLISQSFYRSVSTVKMIFDSLKDLITGKYGMDSVSGVVGMSSVVGEAVQAGFSTVLYIFALITINLGVMNLLPVPALDGGQTLFLVCEMICRRDLNPKIKNTVNTVALMILFAFMALITVKDVLKLFIK